MNKVTLGILSGLAAASIWGGMYVVSKVVLETIPAFTLITCRLILGSLTLGAILFWRRPPRVRWTVYPRLLAVGAIGYGISLGFQFIGTKLSTAANGALVTSATPAFIFVLAWPILGERLGRVRLLALLVSSAGVLAVVDPTTARLDAALFWGNLSLLMAAITWALYSVLIRLVTKELDVLAVSLVAFLGGLPIAVPAAAIELSSGGLGTINVGIVAGVLFLGIICTAVAMLLWNTAFAMLDAGRASLTFFAQPVVGTLLGWYFLGEQTTPLFLIGATLIGVGLLLAARASEG